MDENCRPASGPASGPGSEPGSGPALGPTPDVEAGRSLYPNLPNKEDAERELDDQLSRLPNPPSGAPRVENEYEEVPKMARVLIQPSVPSVPFRPSAPLWPNGEEMFDRIYENTIPPIEETPPLLRPKNAPAPSPPPKPTMTEKQDETEDEDDKFTTVVDNLDNTDQTDNFFDRTLSLSSLDMGSPLERLFQRPEHGSLTSLHQRSRSASPVLTRSQSFPSMTVRSGRRVRFAPSPVRRSASPVFPSPVSSLGRPDSPELTVSSASLASPAPSGSPHPSSSTPAPPTPAPPTPAPSPRASPQLAAMYGDRPFFDNGISFGLLSPIPQLIEFGRRIFNGDTTLDNVPNSPRQLAQTDAPVHAAPSQPAQIAQPAQAAPAQPVQSAQPVSPAQPGHARKLSRKEKQAEQKAKIEAEKEQDRKNHRHGTRSKSKRD